MGPEEKGCWTCFRCCFGRRNPGSAVVPFSSISTQHCFTLQVTPGRCLNVLHIPPKTLNPSDNDKSDSLSGRAFSQQSFHTEILAPFSPERTLIDNSSSSDESEPVEPRNLIVKVELEYIPPPSSIDPRSSKCSLPPLQTPPFTPIPILHNQFESSINNSTYNLNKSRKSVHFEVKSGKEGREEINVEHNFSTKSSISAISGLEEIERIEAEGMELGERRPKSSRSTLGEVCHLSGPQNTQNKLAFFIHGVGGSWSVWRNQIDLFLKLGYEVLSLDLIGHGRSNIPKNKSHYKFSKIKADVLAVFDRYAKTNNVVIAHSYGTCFAAIISRERAEKVTHLVLVSCGAPVSLEPEIGPFFLPAPILCLFRPLIKKNFIKGGFVGKASAEDVRSAFGVSASVLKWTIEGQEWSEGDVAYHRLINAHTLLLYGCEDGFVSIDEMQEMRRAIPGAHLEVIENSSHMVMMEAPSQVNKLLEDFVQLPCKGPIDPEDIVPLRRMSQRPHSSLSRTIPSTKLFAL